MRIREDQLAALAAERARHARAQLREKLALPEEVRVELVGETDLAFIDAEERRCELSFDGRGYALTTPTGRVIRFGLTPSGDVARIESPNGLACRYEYDELRRLVAIVRVVGATRDAPEGALRHELSYDLRGRLTRIRFPDETQRRFYYGGDGAPLSRIEYDRDHKIDLERDAHGRLTRYVDAAGTQTVFDHGDHAPGSVDGPARVVFGDGSDLHFAYDIHGQLSGLRSDNRARAAYRTDAAGRVTEARFDDGGWLSFGYRAGHLYAASTGRHMVRWHRDGGGRVEREEFTAASPHEREMQVCFDYNRAGELTVLDMPGPAAEGPDARQTISYDRDGEGRVERVEDWNGGIYELAYNAGGTLARLRFPNGVETHIESDALGNDTRILTRDPGGAPLVDRRYRYDKRERLSKLDTASLERHYSYDVAGRLTAVRSERRQRREGLAGAPVLRRDAAGELLDAGWSAPGDTDLDAQLFFGDTQLGTDRAGRRTRYEDGRATFDARGRLVALGKETFRYDDWGNLVARRGGPGGAIDYLFEAPNRLVSVCHDGRELVRCEYDAIGRRLLKRTRRGTTYYRWAGLMLTGEERVSRAGRRTRRDYLFLPGEAFPLAMRVNGQSTYYAHVNRLGAPLCYTDERGSVVWRADYSAFGEAVISRSSIDQPWRLPGHYYDEETGLCYGLARYYDPRLGRYLSADPLWAGGGSLEFYSYAGGDPINCIDPHGTFIFTAIVVGALVGAAIGAAIGGGVEAYAQVKEKGEITDGWAVAKEAAIGGVVGAVGGATGGAFAAGASAVGAAGVAAGMAIGAAEGVTTGVVETCIEKEIRDQDHRVGDYVQNAAIGGAIGAVTAGVGGFIARRLKRLKDARRAAADAAAEAAEKEAKLKHLLGPPEDRAHVNDLLRDEARAVGFTEDGAPFTQQTVTNADFVAKQKDTLARLANREQLLEDAAGVGVSPDRIDAMLRREVPLSFDNAQQFQRFQDEFVAAARADGITGPLDVGLSGTSTSFYSNNPAKPGHYFDKAIKDMPPGQTPDITEIGDVDINIVNDGFSDELIAANVRNKPQYNIVSSDETIEYLDGQGRTNLVDFKKRWETELGREVNIVPFRDTSRPVNAFQDFRWSG